MAQFRCSEPVKSEIGPLGASQRGALLGSVASDSTYYSGGTGSSPVGEDGFSERFPLSRLYWYQGLRQVQIPCGNGTV